MPLRCPDLKRQRRLAQTEGAAHVAQDLAELGHHSLRGNWFHTLTTVAPDHLSLKGKIMTFWIIAAVAVHYAAVFLPALFVLGGLGLGGYLGSRDAEPAPGVAHGRAQRALRNAQESFAAFMGLALLSLILPDADQGRAVTGAALYVVGRAVYLPLYIFAVPVGRSVAWTVSLAGIVLIALAVV